MKFLKKYITCIKHADFLEFVLAKFNICLRASFKFVIVWEQFSVGKKKWLKEHGSWIMEGTTLVQSSMDSCRDVIKFIWIRNKNVYSLYDILKQKNLHSI